jgi:hypothetical protein
MASVSAINEHWIKDGAVTIKLNSFDNPDLLQVAILGGTVIMAYKSGVIDYDASHNYRTWDLVAAQTKLETTAQYNLYARLERNGTTALIIYSTDLMDIEGRVINESDSSVTGDASTSYFYIYLGTLSASVDADGASCSRTWVTAFRTGTLATDQFIAEQSSSDFSKMFKLDEVSDLIEVLKTISSAVINRLTSSQITLGDKSVTGIATADPKVEEALTTLLATTNYVAQYTDGKFLSKLNDDIASGKITFNAGLKSLGDVLYGDFASGIVTGFGGRIDKKGNGELQSLIIRDSLTVPVINYNKITITVGYRWLTHGAGIFESVTPDLDEDGNELASGTATLQLEDGEVGAIAVDDICMGIWHNMSGNETESSDDSMGNLRFAGFSTVYFRVDEILDAENKTFRYVLRPTSSTWGNQHHPQPQMNFASYGNFTDKDRQMSYYEAPSYRRQLRDVNTWEFSASNIAMQFGDLSNLSVYGLDMTGYSAFMNNLYVSGTINQISATPLRLTLDTDGDQFLAYGESIHVTCTALRGWEDLTDQVTTWKVERDSGDAAADAVWGQRDKAKNFAGEIDICLSYDPTLNDLGENDNVNKVIFTFTAIIDTETLTTSLEI